jgi:SAM-dependent methyltransferase
MRWAKMDKESIDYRCSNYINDKIEGKYDIAICIYCDFGALIPSEQKAFLKNVHKALNKGGTLILDVFGNGLSKKRKEFRDWTYVQGKDFWSAKPHFLIEESKHFKEQQVWGSRTIVIDEKKNAKEYIMWDTYYSEEKLAENLIENGFKVEEVNRNLVKKNDFTSNDVLFVKARKI